MYTAFGMGVCLVVTPFTNLEKSLIDNSGYETHQLDAYELSQKSSQSNAGFVFLYSDYVHVHGIWNGSLFGCDSIYKLRKITNRQ